MRFPIKVVYVAGPISPANEKTIGENIEAARRLSRSVWSMGAYVLTPHLNSHDAVEAKVVSVSEIYLLDLAMLQRCDAMLLLEGWEESQGANYEHAWADYHEIPVFTSLDELGVWLDKTTRWI